MGDLENKIAVYESFVADMLIALQERMDELNEAGDLSEFQQGRHLAYFEMIDIIKTRHSIILDVLTDDEEEESGHYIRKIEQFLCAKGLLDTSNISLGVKERHEGKVFSMGDHVRGMVYSLLSNQRDWSGVVVHLQDVDRIFFNWDVEQILKANPDLFVSELRRIKCGNRAIQRQMNQLAANIEIFKSLVSKYGSMDAFVTSEPAYQIVEKLSSYKSEYKLHNMGEALVWEYLRNVGIDGAKPDVHMRRFLGGNRMGNGNHSPATTEEVYNTCVSISQETGLSMAEIDTRIWLFCADGYGGVCGASPKCHLCPIRSNCNNCS